MDQRQINVNKMFLRAKTWVTARVASDFTHVPPTLVDNKVAALLATLSSAIVDSAGKRAIQSGGAFGEEVVQQQVWRADVEGVLRDFNRSAGSVATETGQPSIMERFRMPQGDGDEQLASKLRSFADAVDDLALAGPFAALGLTTTSAQLRTMAVDFETNIGEEGTALAERVGAGESIPVIQRSGLGAVKSLNALLNNVFRGNAGLLGEWKSVSHVMREGVDDTPDLVPPTAPQNVALVPSAVGTGILSVSAEVDPAATSQVIHVRGADGLTTDITAASLPYDFSRTPGEEVSVTVTSVGPGGESEPSVPVTGTAP